MSTLVMPCGKTAVVALSLVLLLLIMTSDPIVNPSKVQAAFIQVQPDNTYLPYNGFLDVPPEMVAIPQIAVVKDISLLSPVVLITQYFHD
jgi:hypothetical protein